MIAGTWGDLEQAFGMANEETLLKQGQNNEKFGKYDIETLKEKAKSDPSNLEAIKALKNKQLIVGTKEYKEKEKNGGG